MFAEADRLKKLWAEQEEDVPASGGVHGCCWDLHFPHFCLLWVSGSCCSPNPTSTQTHSSALQPSSCSSFSSSNVKAFCQKATGCSAPLALASQRPVASKARGAGRVRPKSRVRRRRRWSSPGSMHRKRAPELGCLLKFVRLYLSG